MNEPDKVIRVRIEYDLHVPNADAKRPEPDQRNIDRMVADAVRRELARTRRI